MRLDGGLRSRGVHWGTQGGRSPTEPASLGAEMYLTVGRGRSSSVDSDNGDRGRGRLCGVRHLALGGYSKGAFAR